MTLVDIFFFFLDDFEFDGDRIGKIISKAEDAICTGLEKTIEKLTF